MAYWEDTDEKKHGGGVPSLAERLRIRNASKEDLKIEGAYSGRMDETESLEIASYLKVMPVQLEETAIRKKCKNSVRLVEPSREETLKQA